MEDMAYVRLEHISKRFGPVEANDGIDFDVKKGEIHALLGENGSGKSTLMNILSGIYSPDGGRILIGGREMHFASPADAIAAGIGMVHQHFKLVDVLSALENIVAGQKGAFLLRRRELAARVGVVAEKYGLSVELNRKLYEMSVSQRQTVEILKVLCRGADVLILDEPTAVLAPQEIRVLFDIVRNMKRQGCAIILITHKLNEVMEISDRVTVLRKGRSIATLNTAETDTAGLTEAMVGRAISLDIRRPQVPKEKRRPVFEVRGLTVPGSETKDALSGVSFTLNTGEILGVAGIAGSGQKELCEAVYGMARTSAGEIRFHGENLVGMTPKQLIGKGISMSFVPEDRLGMGLVPGMDIIGNVILKSYRGTKGWFLDRRAGKKKAERIIERYSIDTPGPYQIVTRLSGGNIQKVLLGREIETGPQVLITAYPVRGLDIGASYNIYDMLNEQKQNGVAVLFIGEDLDVLLQLCDRIMVLHDGRVMDILPAQAATKERLGMLMLGRRENDGGEQNIG